MAAVHLQLPPQPILNSSMSVPSKLQLLLLAAVLLLSGVSGHAYLASPPARNYLISPDYCPHCLSAGGAERAGRPGGSSTL